MQPATAEQTGADAARLSRRAKGGGRETTERSLEAPLRRGLDVDAPRAKGTPLRRALLSCAAVALLAASGATTAQAAPAGDSVTLTGAPARAGDFTIFALDARSGPSGESPTGRVRFDLFTNSFQFAGPVTCVAVTGDTAIINFRDEIGPFGIHTIRVSDGSTDTFSLLGDGREPTDCSPFPAPGFGGSLSNGDLQVVDAPPLPTTKEQCKGGGWRAYAVFKNQGDCVSFVATAGRNGPAGP